MAIHPSAWAEALGPHRRVYTNHQKAFWDCHWHADKTPSCVGYDDGYCKCFGVSCQRTCSIFDLAVWAETGEMLTKGSPVYGSHLEAAYLKAFKNPIFRGAKRSSKATESRSRNFTDQEQEFLYYVCELLHGFLMNDLGAQAYLISRGVPPLPNFGVGRREHMDAIHAIAKALGNEELPYTTGLASTHEKYYGKLHYMLLDSIVVFSVSGERSSYYQARKIQNGDRVYHTPWGIDKQPIIFGEGPAVGGEGVYDVAWAVPYGYQAVAYLGKPATEFAAKWFKPLNGGLLLADRLPLQASAEFARQVKDKVELSGWSTTIRQPPAPFKDPNDWALGVGLASAADQVGLLLKR